MTDEKQSKYEQKKYVLIEMQRKSREGDKGRRIENFLSI